MAMRTRALAFFGCAQDALSATHTDTAATQDRKANCGGRRSCAPFARFIMLALACRQPFHLNSQRSTRDTAALTMTTTTARIVIPAKTPVVSKVPSA